jgi:hypothetical protein
MVRETSPYSKYMDNDKILELLSDIMQGQVAIIKLLDKNTKRDEENTKAISDLTVSLDKLREDLNKLDTNNTLLSEKFEQLKNKEFATIVEVVSDLIKTNDANHKDLIEKIIQHEDLTKQQLNELKHADLLKHVASILKSQQENFEKCTNKITNVITTVEDNDKKNKVKLNTIDKTSKTIASRLNSMDTSVRTALERGPLAETEVMQIIKEERKEISSDNKLDEIEKLRNKLATATKQVIE